MSDPTESDSSDVLPPTDSDNSYAEPGASGSPAELASAPSDASDAPQDTSLAAHNASDDSADESLEPPEREVEGAVPPGYDWPTHGGYLGCLVATIAACLLTGFIGANLFSFLYIARRWPFPFFALLTLVLFVALLVGLGRLGWQLGKRFYRYYPQVRPTWGESDVATAEGIEEAAEVELAPVSSGAHDGVPEDGVPGGGDEQGADTEEPAASEEPAAQVPSSPQGESDG